MAAGEGAESILGHCGGIAQRARSEADAPGDKGTGRETMERFSKLGGGRDDQGLHLVDGLSAGFDG